MITTCATSTDSRLVTLEDVKDAMAITDAQYDETLARFIRRASARIETYVGKPLLLQTYQVALPSYGGPVLQLPHAPVRTIFRVFDGTDTGSAQSLTSTEYKADLSRGQLYREEGWGWSAQSYAEVAPWPAHEAHRWLIEYSAGYVPAAGKTSTGDGTTSTDTSIPFDIQEAAISLTRSMWLSRQREGGVRSKRVGELSIDYTTNSGTLPDDVAAMLQPYRSIF